MNSQLALANGLRGDETNLPRLGHNLDCKKGELS